MPPVVGWPVFPFEGELRLKPFAEPGPEQPRRGAGGVDCPTCERLDSSFLWTDEHWRVGTTREPSGLPAVLFLYRRAHHDLADLPPQLAAGYGPMMQRVEAAYMSLGGIARVRQARWGDGSEHLHLWFFGRPEGMRQLRGR